MAQISLSLYVANDQGKVIEVEDHMTVDSIIPSLLRLNGAEDLSPDMIRQCTILVSRRIEIDVETTLQQLGIRNGDALSLIIHVPTSKIALLLDPMVPGFQSIRITRTGRTVGRRDEDRPESQPDYDLLPFLSYLSRQRGLSSEQARLLERKISQQQAQFVEQDGLWSVQMIGRAPMFVNSERLVTNQRVVLHEGNVIAFGDNPNRPILRLNVQFENVDSPRRE